ncbi:MAG: hypothetical protein HUK15_01005 [Bacteroidales bacterium]|nr:hypothetical protein [Bacteroidales bacterium]
MADIGFVQCAFGRIKLFFLLFAFAAIPYFATGQSFVSLKQLSAVGDSIMLDSLSVVQSSIKFLDADGKPVNLKYHFDFETSMLYFDEMPPEGVKVQFKTFPVNFSQKSQKFDREKYMLSDHGNKNPDYDFVFTKENYDNFFTQTELSRKGSISRGVSFGNNQSVIMNSNLDLQLDGKIGENLFISAVISDNNIPIQPDGNSQQLQEFDKVFIKIYNQNFSLVAGDFEQKRPMGYFLNYYKKSQGVLLGGKVALPQKSSESANELNMSVGAAVAKGKYHKMQIAGVEGNQGPYRLTGANNESYVIVLAGTEKVYIDGMLMTRGSDRDYVIDYNLGEITFTALQPINKDKRIVVEFEYTDQNYTRFLVTSSNSAKIGNAEIWLNLYNESDAKNQTINLDLSDADKRLMSGIGDNLQQAIIHGYDSIGFNADEVRYMLVDTIVDGILYDSVFVYSTNPNEAFYRVAFSLVGENNGDYVRGNPAVNGRVYEWVAPINGVPQGNYAPYTKIVAPQKKQMATIGAKSAFGKMTNASVELALSNNDLNTFSKLDSDDDFGLAVRTNIEQYFIKTEKNALSFDVDYDFISSNFDAVEYFRETEFLRNWNVDSYYANSHCENLIDASLKYSNKKHGGSQLVSSYINRGAEYAGWKNDFSSNYTINTWKIGGNASFLATTDSLNETKFLRHDFSFSKSFGKIAVGASEMGEDNRWKNSEGILLDNSYSFNQVSAFVESTDSTKQKFSASYKFRNDKKNLQNSLRNATNAHDVSLSTELKHKEFQRFKATVNYRLLQVCDTSLYTSNPEDNLTGKLEYNLKLFKGAISSATLYEIGSGLENKLEFTYIEVAPGQGVYTWTDYNGNGVQEIDEFEVAFFSDQANFIRVQMPTTQYVKVYSNQFNQSLNINPSAVWRQKSGFKKFLSRFSDQFAYSIAQKNTSSKILEFANPFANNIDAADLVSLNSSIRNNFSFNKAKPKFGIDYIVQAVKNKSLLTTGFDSRTNFTQNVLVRYNISTKVGMQNTTIFGKKTYDSELFASKNYKISSVKNDFRFNLQPNMSNRLSLTYIFETKQNVSGVEKLMCNNVGVEYRLNSVEKGSLNANFNFIHYKYDGAENSSIDYEMLQGLQPGVNFTWGVNFQRQLTNGLQINISYTGRKSPQTAFVHTASMQISAYF